MYTYNPAKTELERLLKSAEAAHDLAEKMLETKTEIPGGMAAVARGLEDSAKAADLVAEQERGRQLAKSVMALGAPPNGVWRDDDNPENSGGFFTAEAKAGIVHAVKTRTAYRAELPAKAALTTGALLPTSGTTVQEGLHPNAQFPLASLFRQVAAEGPTVRYYRMTAGSAAVVAEGALKPDAGIEITPVDLALAKIACTAQFSDEMAEDAPYLVSYLSAELSAAVLAAENARLLATFDATSGVLTGTGTTATVVDLIADAISGQEAVSGKTPAAVVAHPSVVATIRKAKATDNQFLLDPLTSGPTTIHGVRLIPTPATDTGVAWVVEASGVQVYRRGPLTVEVGTNADDWSKNLRTVRAEERMAAAVTRPTSLTKLTLT